MNVHIGTAPDNWGVWFSSDPKQTPWDRYLDEVVEAGYNCTELGPPGYLPADPKVLEKELGRRNLTACGTVVMRHLEDSGCWPILRQDVLTMGALLQGLGAKYLVVIDDVYSNLFTGEFTLPKTLDSAGWQSLIATTHRVAELARSKFGLEVVFHPHAETHVEYENQIEAFLEQTDPALVSLCLDTGHHAYRWRRAGVLLPKTPCPNSVPASKKHRSSGSGQGTRGEHSFRDRRRHGHVLRARAGRSRF